MFDERVNRLANALLSLGLQKGERVALLSLNRHQLVEGIYGCYKSGLVRVALNARLSIQELIYMLNDSEPSVVILGPEFINQIAHAYFEIKTVRYYIAISNAPTSMIDYEEFLSKASPEEPKIEVGLDDSGYFNYTAGTTGILKAAILSHRNRICLAKKILLAPDTEILRDSVMCHVGAITHASGGMILPFIMRGGCNVIMERFDIKLLLETIQEEKVSHLFVVPTMLNFIMDYPDLKRYDLRSIKTIFYGGSPMPVEKIKLALQIFGPVLIQIYGQTETSSAITFLSKEDHLFEGDPKRLRRLSSAGVPSIECNVRVVDERGEDVKTGLMGEIIERGDDTMLGYWKDPELTAKTIRKGWIYTGDLGIVDEDGYIYIVDRKSDMIISGGLNIYPSEVEKVLQEHPAISDTTVFGVPDEQWGESVMAVIVLKEGMSVKKEEIIDYCKQRLASYKKPKSVEFVTELPKNVYGKVIRKKLKERYWVGQERMVH